MNGTVRALVALFVAVLFGGIAVVALFNLITRYQAEIEEQKQPEDTVMAIVAARDLYAGVEITGEDLIAVQIPPRFLPENGTFLSPDHVIGQRPRERILANEFVRASRLASPETGEGLNAIIPEGKRAIAIEVADGKALSGHLSPGDSVDVLVTLESTELNPEPTSDVLLQTIFVLAVNDEANNVTAESDSQTVTLLVNAEQSRAVTQAEATGELRLVVRNITDQQLAEANGINMDKLLGIVVEKKKVRTRRRSRPKAAPAPAAEPDPVNTIRLIQGKTTKEQEVK